LGPCLSPPAAFPLPYVWEGCFEDGSGKGSEKGFLLGGKGIGDASGKMSNFFFLIWGGIFKEKVLCE
jgi:hypothetical protein